MRTSERVKRIVRAALPVMTVLAPLAAESAEPPEDPVPLPLVCRGNEPFWALSLTPASAVLERLLETTTRLDLTGAATHADFLRPPLLVWRGRAAAGAGDLVAVITRERCADTMADRTYGFRSVVSLAGGEVLTGCCERGDGGRSPRD